MEDATLNIPIPHYPPFKLRSSLIDKDPVIWVHLLAGYVDLFKVLEGGRSKNLSTKSEKQLQLFLKVFLSETYDEATKIFALGSINPQIKENQSILKAYVFQFIKNHSIVKCNFSAETIWHFICVYVEKNATVVRGLVDGSFTSMYNDNAKSGKVNSIPSLQKYLETLLMQGKFQEKELRFLSLFIGQYITSIKKAKAFKISASGPGDSERIINKRKAKTNNIAEKFVNKMWIDKLETLYAGGKSNQAKWIESTMIASLISLSIGGLSKLTTELGINNVASLKVSPLFSTILISDSMKQLMPGIEDRLPFLRNINFESNDSGVDSKVKQEDFTTLVDMFPGMTRGKAVTILEENGGDVSKVIENLLESPDLISSIPEHEKPQNEQIKQKDIKVDKLLQGRFSSAQKPNILRKPKIHSIEKSRPSQDHREKTLEAALRIMYESDEDEPDDTYQDTENTGDPTSGST